jgi:hypothetical protein
MAESAPESRLMAALELVNDWLKYAEVKNAALLTLNAALIVGMHQLFEWHKPTALGVGWLLWMSTALLAISLLVCLASFYAYTKTFGFDLPISTQDGATNALYFGHLADMKRDDVLKRLVDKYAPGPGSNYLEDMADQIIINSKIARRKFAFFNWGLMFTIAALLTPVGALLFYWRFCDDRL